MSYGFCFPEKPWLTHMVKRLELKDLFSSFCLKLVLLLISNLGTLLSNLGTLLCQQKHYFANKGPSSQSYGFSSSHVWM